MTNQKLDLFLPITQVHGGCASPTIHSGRGIAWSMPVYQAGSLLKGSEIQWLDTRCWARGPVFPLPFLFFFFTDPAAVFCSEFARLPVFVIIWPA